MPYDDSGKYVVGAISFNPADVLVKVKGSTKPNYLEVKFRLVMLREMFPEATLVTKLLFHDPEKGVAITQATIKLPNGAVGTGTKMEEKAHFTDFVEKSETGAVGRALYAVGIGAQYSNVDYDYEADSPKAFKGVDSPIDIIKSDSQKEAAKKTTQIKTRETFMEDLVKEANRLTPIVLSEKSQSLFGTAQSSKLTIDQLKELIEWAKTQ